MTKEEIREITNKAKSPCLVGIRGFDADIQQYTCKFINGKNCTCYKNYKDALDVETRKRINIFNKKNTTMKTNALLKLHQRQVDVLDMIVTCNNKIQSAESDLRRITNNVSQEQIWWNEFTMADKHYKGEVAKYESIKQRLIKYYLDIQERITLMQPNVLSDSEGDLLIQQHLS